MTFPARPSHVATVPLADLAVSINATLAQGTDAMSVAAALPGVTSVSGISLSSARVRPGDLYAALPGARTHGARFATEAATAGAVAILTDVEGMALSQPAALPTLVVASPRQVLGRLSALIYGNPAERLTLIGVTGTQGKTTTTQLMGAALAAAGRRGSVIGTMGTWIDQRPVGSALTTPEAPDLHALFAVMLEEGIEVCAMEVSSHAVVMGRVDGVVFDLTVFTNLGRDHLDFHADLEDYFAAKAQLFTPQRARRALVNLDDAYGRRLAQSRAIPTLTFSAQPGTADWTCETVAADEHGSTFVLHGPGPVEVATSVPLAGDFNVVNSLCALAALSETGTDIVAAATGIAKVGTVAGRMEQIDCGQAFSVVVDYAHKPDAVAAMLRALRPVTSGRLIVVFGAGGDRDQGKRRLMGEVASQLADVVLVTDDNPRTEDPAAIRAEVLAGVRDSGAVVEVHEIGDRLAAITAALRQAAPGDTVVVAGKGHERGQEVQGHVHPFDDRDVARQVLDALAGENA